MWWWSVSRRAWKQKWPACCGCRQRCSTRSSSYSPEWKEVDRRVESDKWNLFSGSDRKRKPSMRFEAPSQVPEVWIRSRIPKTAKVHHHHLTMSPQPHGSTVCRKIRAMESWIISPCCHHRVKFHSGTNKEDTNLVTHHAPCSVVAWFCFSVGACFRSDGRTPCVKIMTTYWPGPSGSFVLFLPGQFESWGLSGKTQRSTGPPDWSWRTKNSAPSHWKKKGIMTNKKTCVCHQWSPRPEPQFCH